MPATIRKNATENLQVERTVYNGHDLLDVRVWTAPPPGEDAKPTKKGLTLPPDTWRALLPLIAAELEGGAEHGNP